MTARSSTASSSRRLPGQWYWESRRRKASLTGATERAKRDWKATEVRMGEEGGLLTPAQVAVELDTTERTVRRWIRDGLLEAVPLHPEGAKVPRYAVPKSAVVSGSILLMMSVLAWRFFMVYRSLFSNLSPIFVDIIIHKI